MLAIQKFVRNEIVALTKKWNDECTVTGHATPSHHTDIIGNLSWEVLAERHANVVLENRQCIKLHWANQRVWYHEDFCRSGDDMLTATHKPQIDIHNQIRNDLIEWLDEYLINEQAVLPERVEDQVPYNTETPGSVIDRISVLSLKTYYWGRLVSDGCDKFLPKYLVAKDQLEFMIDQFDKLLDDMRRGKRRIRLFKQLKMYNNPETNSRHKDAKQDTV